MEAKIADLQTRLVMLEATVENETTRAEERHQALVEELADLTSLLRKTLYGTPATHGLLVKVDRLEQWKRTASRILWMIVGALITMSVHLLAQGLKLYGG